MASEEPVAAGLANAGEESVAQRLQQHHVTVEDVPDDELPTQPTEEASASGSSPAVKAAGKPKQAALDTQSHELFPELGAPKGKSPSVAPIWGAKSNANGGSNGVSRSSTPASGTSTPSAQAPTPSMAIPGRRVETYTLAPHHVRPRSELRRPIPDILKDINRKSRANITMTQSPNGHLKFIATGPQEAAQQALKDLVGQIGLKVCTQNLSTFLAWRPLLIASSLPFKGFHQGPHSSIQPSLHHRQGWCHNKVSPGEDWCQDPAAQV